MVDKPPKTPKPPKPAMPPSPKARDVSAAPRPKIGVRAKSLLRVFKPLLLLPLLAIAAILVYTFVPEKVRGYSLNLYCLIFIGVLAGIVVLYVLVRLVNYLIEWRRIRKQEELLGRQELLRLHESLTERWERVEALLKSASVGLYNMPWYVILGGASGGAQALLRDSGLTFPDVEGVHALIPDANVIDRWVFTNEAIFIDMTARGRRDLTRESEKAEWDAFLGLLAQRRHRCPVNGMIVAVSVQELAEDSPETRKTKARLILSRIRHVQKRLEIGLPLYLVVTQMGTVMGFSEFFAGLSAEERAQILGWSNPHPPGARFSPQIFFQAFEGLTRVLRAQRVSRLHEDISQGVAQRALLFPEEFTCLREPLGDYVRTLFEESRFAERPLFRGFYFTGGREPGSLTTLYNKKNLPANVLQSLAQSAETGAPSRSLFTTDLFTRKIFLEPGLVRRPRSVFRKNLKIKTVGALAVGLFIAVSTFYLVSFSKNWAEEIRTLEVGIQQARNVLLERRADVNTLPLCIRLTKDRQGLKQKGFLARTLGLGRYDLLASDLGVIHRTLFQETVLIGIVDKVETGIKAWRGVRSRGEPDFNVFSSALVEYIRWSNPTFRLRHPLKLKPFLDFLQFPLKTKYQYIDQFQVYIEEGGRGRRLVGSSSEEIILHSMAKARIYLRPTLPMTEIAGPQLSQAQWWLRLAAQLRRIRQDYQGLLNSRVPVEYTPFEELSALHGEFDGFLYGFLLGTRDMLAHIRGGRESGVSWIDVDDFYDRLLSAGSGVAVLETTVERDRLNAAKDYNERVVDEIVLLAPLINMLSGYPSHSWLMDVLARAFGIDFTTRVSDLGAGHMILDLLTKVESCDRLIQEFYASLEPWMEKLPDEIKTLADFEIPLRRAEFNQRRVALQKSKQDLEAFASEPSGTGPGQPAAAPVAPVPGPMSEEDKLKEEKRKAVVSYWEALTLSSRTSRWLEVQERMRRYIETHYLEEILVRLHFQKEILEANSWYDIKTMEVFRKGDGIDMVTPVSDFLEEWIQYIPRPMMASAKGREEAKHYPELRRFEKLLKEVITLQENFMDELRGSANSFAKCIQAMDADVAVAWQTLRDSPWPNEITDQLVSWKNIQHLTLFKENLETEKGPIARAITGRLEEIESHVINIYRSELIAAYQSERAQVSDRYKKLRIDEKFPFRVDGPQMDDALLLQFLEDLGSLERRFELDQGPYRVGLDGKKRPLYPLAGDIVGEMTSDRYRLFYENSIAFGSFLFEKSTPRTHKFKVSIEPGPVGSYFHWVRMSFGDGTFKDINVYGEPVLEMTMNPGDGSVTLQGLDAARMPQASAEVTKGRHALLQMIYLLGKPLDELRTTWVIDVDLPMSVNPAFNVKSPFKFVFPNGLPVLPDWKNMGS